MPLKRWTLQITEWKELLLQHSCLYMFLFDDFQPLPVVSAINSDDMDIYTEHFSRENLWERILSATSLLTFVNSCLNPVLYVFLSK